jgi:hypothetical protein
MWNKMALSKFLKDLFGERMGVEGVLVTLQLLSILKRVLAN